jgi:adenosine deaminase
MQKMTRTALLRHEFIRRMPKVELHVHLDGAYDHDRLFHWAQKHIEELPLTVRVPTGHYDISVREAIRKCDHIEAFSKLVSCPTTPPFTLNSCLECFHLFQPIVQGRRAVIEDMAYHFARNQSRSGILYTEARYSPHLLLSPLFPTLTVRDVCEAVSDGLDRGAKEFNIVIKQLYCAIDFSPSWAEEVVTLAGEFRKRGVVGVDIAAGEEHFEIGSESHKIHASAMTRAKEMGLNITIHAAETTCADNVITALKAYHTDRIGHGYQLMADEKLYAHVRETVPHLHFEMCPSSSLLTGGFTKEWKEHPFIQFQKDGFSVGINTDDPGPMLTTLEKEYDIVMTEMGLNESVLESCLLASITAAFCDDTLKASLTQSVKSYFASTTIAN